MEILGFLLFFNTKSVVNFDFRIQNGEISKNCLKYPNHLSQMIYPHKLPPQHGKHALLKTKKIKYKQPLRCTH